MAGRCPPALEIEKNPLNLRYLREIKSPLAGRCPPALEIEKYPLNLRDLREQNHLLREKIRHGAGVIPSSMGEKHTPKLGG